MLHEVDQSLKNMLVAEFKDVEGRPIADDSQITIGPPPETGFKPKKPTINLFLHDLHESPNLRNFAFETKPTTDDWEVGRSLKPTHLNLSYMITAHAEDPLDEHRLLGETLGILMRKPVVESRHLVGSLQNYKDEAMKLSIAQRDHFAHGDGAKVWQATGHPLRPFIGLVIAAMFDPFETRLTKRVREAIFSLGHEPHPEGEKRQMDIHRVRIGAAGMVSDSKSGEPIADVKVSVEGRPESTLTDAGGVFYFRNLPVGRHQLTFAKATFKTQVAEAVTPPVGRANEMELMDVKLSSATDSERVAGLIQDPKFQVPGAELIGTLRFADGSPAAFIPVRVNDRTAVTDADGQYHFTNVPGPIRELVAEIPGMGEVARPIDPAKPTVELGKK
jgi:hypothetical protein